MQTVLFIRWAHHVNIYHTCTFMFPVSKHSGIRAARWYNYVLTYGRRLVVTYGIRDPRVIILPN